MKKITALGVATLIAASAGACGRMADLEAPPAKQTERGMRGADAPSLPEPSTVYQPPSERPIDGGPNTSAYSGSGANPGPR